MAFYSLLKRAALAALLIAGLSSPALAARAYHDITCETTATTGTGTITLGGASGQYKPFSAQFSSGDTVSYGITSGDGKYETGIGVYTAGAPGTMTRASSIISTDGVGTLLTLSGTSTVCVEFNSVWFQPNLGTADSPTFGGLTLSSPLTAGNGGTGLSSLGTGVATWLGTPSSANLASALTDETGSGAAVFANSPTFGALTSDAGGTHTFPDGWAANAELIDTLYPAFWLHGTTNNRGVVYAMDASSNKFWLEPETAGVAGGTHQLYWDLSAFTFEPGHNGDWALGSATLSWSNLFLASGGVINWNNGDVTLTHSSNLVTVGGGDLRVNSGTDATQATATTYPVQISDAAGTGNITLGYDGTYDVIQSWNSKSLYLNPQGNPVIIGSGNLELGNVSDTTLARTAAGRVTIEGQPVGLYTFAATAPVSPQVGDTWVDSTTSIAYRYINDGDSSQWVQQPGNSVNTSTVKVQKFTASGTYTPTAGMKTAIIECVGGGGGGGGVALSSGEGVAGGGGGGSYSRAYVTAAQVGASQTVTIGGTANGGTAGTNNGSAGNDTSVGTLCVGKGGSQGLGAGANSSALGGAGGVAGTGDVTVPGEPGGAGGGGTINTMAGGGGRGGNSALGWGGGGQQGKGNGAGAGAAGGLYGGGGAGGVSQNSTAAVGGGTGAAGIVVITEYLTGP